MRSSFIELLVATGTAAALAMPAAGDPEYVAGTFGDAVTTPIPPAHIEQSQPPHVYEVTAEPGVVHNRNQYVNCCVDCATRWGSFLFDDVVFSSPDGGGGTALVRLNLGVVGDFTTTSCSGSSGSMQLNATVGQVLHSARWYGGGAPCSSYDSSGFFTGYNDMSIDAQVTTGWGAVPLDTPVHLQVYTLTTICSHSNATATIDTHVSLPGGAVFEFVDPEAVVSVDSVQGSIVRNVWQNAEPCVADIDGNGAVDVTDLLDLLASWGPCGGCAADLDGSGTVDVTDLLAMLAAWGGC